MFHRDSSGTMKDLDRDYTMESGQFDDRCWYEIMQRFDEANLYQTPSFDMVGLGPQNYKHLILKRRNEIIAAAQARVIKLPLIKAGIAYVLWGPMWNQKGIPADPTIFRQVIRALRNEFSVRRGLELRVFPPVFQRQNDFLKQIILDEGFCSHDDGKTNRTLIIDLAPSLQEIRAFLDQKWRNCLNRAEKNGFELIEGEEDYLFDEIAKIQSEMANRKGITDLGDVEHLKKVQRYLPPGYKLRVILCLLNGEIHAGAIFSAIGTSAVYLVGATSNAGMKSNGSYIIQWSFIKWLKEKGILYYNLNGINPVTNPGTYHFKRGLAGKKGMDVTFLGKFQVADNPLSALVVNGGESLVSIYKRVLRKSRMVKNAANHEQPTK